MRPFHVLVTVLVTTLMVGEMSRVSAEDTVKRKNSRAVRQTSADQMVQNILRWLQGVYSQQSRKIRQGTLREYLPPTNTQKPRPFEPRPSGDGTDDQGNFVDTGYPPAGITPQPPFPTGPGGYPGPSTLPPPTLPTRYPDRPGFPTAPPTDVTGYPAHSYPTPGFPTRPPTGYPGTTERPGFPTQPPVGTTEKPTYPTYPTPGYPTQQPPGPTESPQPVPTEGGGYPSTPGFTGYPTGRPTTGYPTGRPGFPTAPPTTGYPTGRPGFPTAPPTTGYPTGRPGFPTGPPSTGYPTGRPGFPTAPSPGVTPPEYPGSTPERPGYPTQPPPGPGPGSTLPTGYPTFPEYSTPGSPGGETSNVPVTPPPSTSPGGPGPTGTPPTGRPGTPGDQEPGGSTDEEDLKHPPHIHAIDVQCAKDMMTINIEFNREFNGIIYSKGYYNMPECRYVNENSGQTKYTFTVNLNMCGTEFINAFDTQGQSYLENVLVLQNEAGVQEIWDTVRAVRCLWEGNLKEQLSISLMVGMLTQEIVTFSGDTAMAKLDIVLGRGPFGQPAGGLVKIGEQMTLVVSVSGDSGFDVQVKDCKAVDTTDSNEILLTDDNGCVLKPKLFGAFQKTRNTENTGASIIAYAYFNAFKFPDAMDLLIECNIELCKTDCEMCPNVDQPLEPSKRRRRDIRNETLHDGVMMGKHLRVVLPEDLASATLVSEDFCMSTQNFLFASCLLISLLLSSCVLSVCMWLKVQRLQFKH